MKMLIIGGGRVLYFLCRKFLSRGDTLTIINKDHEECVNLARRLDTAILVHGEGSDPDVLEEAGAENAEIVIAVTPNDHDNLIICQIAKLHFNVPRAVAVVNDPDNEEAFKKLGVEAFSITRTIAELIEQKMVCEEITNIIPAGEGKVNITEISVNEKSPAINKKLSAISLPENSLIAVVIRNENPIVPHGSTELHIGDRLVIVTLPENHGEVVRLFTGEQD